MRWREYRNKILSAVDAEAFYTDELKKRGLVYARHGIELKSQCPFSELHMAGKDSNPSFTVNLSSGVYFCNACGSKGNIHTFLMTTQSLSKQDAWYTLGDALGFDRPEDADTRPAIDPGLPAAWHKKLITATGVVRDILRDKRGLTDDTLARFQIGWDGDRVTIPIYDAMNELINIRRYKWNSYEDSTKMINYENESGDTYGEVAIYGAEWLYDEECPAIIWCEGEWDRLVLEQNGLHACTATAGANNFRAEWLSPLRKKERVYICYDNDNAGRLATEKLVNQLRGQVELYVVCWPDNFLDKGDVTDYFVKQQHSKEQFIGLFKKLDNYEDVPVVTLAAATDARYTGKRIKVPVLVSGKAGTPFVYPKSIRVSCYDYDPDNKKCGSCILATKHTNAIELSSDNPLLLKIIGCSDEQQSAILSSKLGKNPKCYGGNYEVLSYGNLEVIRMVPKADTGFGYSKRVEYVAREGYVIGNDLQSNKRYTLVGYMHPDPNNQQATFLFDTAVPERDITEELEVTNDFVDELKIFQPLPGQSVKEKFEEIHRDLERNVTYIWERRSVGYAVDLIYHTITSFIFQEQRVRRGWGECLIIGDSGQAKTTLVERLMEHYQAGELLSGESSRRTGLVYSMQQTASGGWTLVWGAMPLNDGGLLTIDELSGINEDDLAKMSDVRSSGIAKATGVITAETTARTRMIFISNPRNGRQLKSENYGVSHVLKLFGKAEDVRRLDFALGVASGDVPAELVNKAVSEMPAVPHVYTKELCKKRVQWAWSRTPEQVKFTPEATTEILAAAVKMGKVYNSRIPLVEAADQRIKIARLSVATAACMFSTDDGTNVIVTAEHVAFVVEFLNSCYTSRALGYDRFSTDEFISSDSTDGSILRIRKQFASIPLVSHEPAEVIRALYQLPYFNRNTLEDATGLDRDEVKALMQFLISNVLVEKAAQDYRRTPLGLSFIEAVLQEPITPTEMREARAERFAKTEL